jgi:hypothetical protein
LTSEGVKDENRKVVIASPDKWGDRYQELIGLYNNLLLQQKGS